MNLELVTKEDLEAIRNQLDALVSEIRALRNAKAISSQQLFYSMKDLQKVLGLSFNSIKKLIRKHGLPYINTGDSIRFSSEDIQIWIRKNRINGMEFHGKNLKID